MFYFIAIYFETQYFRSVNSFSKSFRDCFRMPASLEPRIARSDEKHRDGGLLVGCWLACQYEEVRDPGTKWHIRSKGGRRRFSLYFPRSLHPSISFSRSTPFPTDISPRKLCMRASKAFVDHQAKILFSFITKISMNYYIFTI